MKINAITFAPFSVRGTFEREETYASFDKMKENTCANHVVLVPVGYQETAQSETIVYESENNVSDDELRRISE
mgnify:CR=1 FL=1